jgi:predicted ferric reductase
MDLQKEFFVAIAGPMLIGLLTMLKDRKNTEMHVLSYEPYTFFEIFERHLNRNGYTYLKEVKGNDDFLSSNYITYYYLDDSEEEIKINWKDLDRSDIQAQASFLKFGDKAFIKDLMEELKEQRPPIKYFQFNKYSFGFATVFISWA